MTSWRQCNVSSNNFTYLPADPCKFCTATFGTSSAYQTLILDEILLCPTNSQTDEDKQDFVQRKLLSILETESRVVAGKLPVDFSRNIAGLRRTSEVEASNATNSHGGENRQAGLPVSGESSAEVSHSSEEVLDLGEAFQASCSARLQKAVDLLGKCAESPCQCLFAVYRLVKLYALYTLADGGVSQWRRKKEEGCCLRDQVLALLRLFAAVKVNMNLGTCRNFDLPLMTAVAIGDTEVVRQLLMGGASPDLGTGREEVTSLALAILLNNDGLVRVLLEHGASAVNRCTRTLTPLRLSFDSSSKVADGLFDHGAKLQDLDTVEHPLSAIGHAISTGNTYLTEMLIRFGSNVNQSCTALTSSYLHLAVGHSDLPMVELLLKHGIRTSCLSSEPQITPLGLAICMAAQPSAVVGAWRCGAPSSVSRCFGATGLHIVRALLLANCNRLTPSRVETMGEKFPPMHIACFFGHLPAINLLLKAEIRHLQLTSRAKLCKDCEISRRRKSLVTPCSACREHQKELEGRVVTLDDLGANNLDLENLNLNEYETEGVKSFLNQKCQDVTPIMQLAQGGHLSGLRYLLELGADGQHFGRSGGLLHQALVGKTSEEVLTCCLDTCGGAGIDKADALGNTPLHLASRVQGGLCLALCQRGCNLNIRDRGGETSLSSSIYFGVSDASEILLQHGADPDIPDKSGATAIYWAIFNNRESTVRLLLEAGCYLTQKLLRSYPANLTLMRNAQLKQLLVDYVHQPRSLMHLSRHTIRQHLSKSTGGRSIVKHISPLPIPSVLKQYLVLQPPLKPSQVPEELQ